MSNAILPAAIGSIADKSSIRVVLFANGQLVHVSLAELLKTMQAKEEPAETERTEPGSTGMGLAAASSASAESLQELIEIIVAAPFGIDGEDFLDQAE